MIHIYLFYKGYLIKCKIEFERSSLVSNELLKVLNFKIKFNYLNHASSLVNYYMS